MQGHSAKLSGTDFAARVGLEDVAKGLFRLASVFGQPFGTDTAGLRQMAAEWHQALGDLPPAHFDRAVSDWIATESKWPRPADLRVKASQRTGEAAARVSRERKVHERRINPSPNMLPATIMRSKLRLNDDWDAFLDAIHPVAEHSYFVQAILRGRCELLVPNLHRADYIREHFGALLASHFGTFVTVTVDPSQAYDQVPV
jgi:hypothetical protein